MLTEKQLTRLTLLMMKENFSESPAAQEPQYLETVERYAKLSTRLWDKLDDRRREMLRELLELRDQMEYDHNLHYLMRGVLRGVDLADNIELCGESFILP